MNKSIVYDLAEWTSNTIVELEGALGDAGVDYKFELDELIISKPDEDLVDRLIKQISAEVLVATEEPRDVVYDLTGWSNAERIKFKDALGSAGLIHDYNGTEIAVGESLEAKVDELLLSVHGVTPRSDDFQETATTYLPLWKRVWFIVFVWPLAALTAVAAILVLFEEERKYSPAESADKPAAVEITASTALQEQTTTTTITTIQPIPTTTIDKVEADKTKYRTESRAITKETISSLVTLERLFQNPDIFDQLWVLDVAGELLTFRTAYDNALRLSVPANYQGAHNNLMSALSTLNKVSFDLPRAIDSLNTKEAGRQAQKMWGTLNALDRFTTATNQ